MNIIRPTVCEVNLANLKHNAKLLINCAQNHPFFCPMVKANGYGHGDIKVAQTLENIGIKRLGVVLIEEAMRLRAAGIKSDILIFGYLNSDAVRLCKQFNLVPVVSSFEYLKCLKLEKYRGKIHIKLDTGMNRLGFKQEEWKTLLQELDLFPEIEVEGIATHFLNAEDIGESEGYTHRQLLLFQEAENIFKNRFQYSHCLNSSALLQKYSFKGARPGIALYGYKPAMKVESVIHLKPVMTVKTVLSQIKKIKKNEVVSYGAIWTAEKDSLIGILPIGYADGLPRSLSNKGDVLIQKTRVPLIGRVCMDYCMVDLTHFKNKSDLRIGEEVVVWGYQGSELLSLDEHARNTNTISYEFVTRIGERVPKIFLEA